MKIMEEEKSMQEQMDKLTEWLELHEIDDVDYAEKFRELQQLEMEVFYDAD